MDVWPGQPVPARPDLGRQGTNFAIFTENAERVELCLFDDDDEETRIELDRARGVQLALLHPRHRAGPAVRLPRPRRLRPGDRARGSTRTSS